MSRPEVIGVGASAGGVTAIQKLLQGLNKPLPVPVVVAQHLPASMATDVALVFGRSTRSKIHEAIDKMPIEPGHIYFAPGGYHMQVERPGYLSLSLDEPVNYSRPSIDVLFASLAWAFGKKACGIILTGANSDGAEGLQNLKQAGAVTIAQDPGEAEAPLMPASAIARSVPDFILPIPAIAAKLNEWWAYDRKN